MLHSQGEETLEKIRLEIWLHDVFLGWILLINFKTHDLAYGASNSKGAAFHCRHT